MPNPLYYLHKLEQIQCAIHDATEALEEHTQRLRADIESGKTQLQRVLRHISFIENTAVATTADELNILVERMKNDAELEIDSVLAAEIVSTSQHALRACAKLEQITELLGDG